MDPAFLGVLMKKELPRDNSCLFNSIYFALNGHEDETGTAALAMRQIVAEAVANSPDTFSEAVLGRPNHDYCVAILDDGSRGGAVELAVLAKHYGFEIAVVDAAQVVIDQFGEGEEYSLRIFLMFDGSHYDALYLELPDGNIQTIFPTDDEDIMTQAEEIALEASFGR